jgi:uncharacterized protein (DUF2252 family)
MTVRDHGEDRSGATSDLVAVRRQVPGRATDIRTGAARGKAARGSAPRSSQGEWTAPARRGDPVDILVAQAAGRLPDLLPIRHGRMMASPFAFFRGSAAVMARDLAGTVDSGITVQLCGDAHVSNFGGYAAPDRQLVFDVNDFDETLPGPWEWDVKRLVASIAIAGRGRGLGRKQRQRMVRQTAEAYRVAMREFARQGNLDVWYSRLTAHDIRDRWGAQASSTALRSFDRHVDKALRRDRARAARELTRLVDGTPRLVSDPPLVVPLDELLPDHERRGVEEGVQAAFKTYRDSLPGSRRHLLDQFRYSSMTRKVVGVGSVGTRSWVVLMLGVDRGDQLFLQLKEASESVLAPYSDRRPRGNQGQRVVEGQKLMQAGSDIFLGWSRGPALDGTSRDFYVRQLWDWRLSAEIDHQAPETLGLHGQICAWTLARAHARSGDRLAIATYLGSRDVFDAAMAEFAEAYADQNAADHGRFVQAVSTSRLDALPGV